MKINKGVGFVLGALGLFSSYFIPFSEKNLVKLDPNHTIEFVYDNRNEFHETEISIPSEEIETVKNDCSLENILISKGQEDYISKTARNLKTYCSVDITGNELVEVAKMLHYEAGGEGNCSIESEDKECGMTPVAHVIKNRFESDKQNNIFRFSKGRLASVITAHKEEWDAYRAFKEHFETPGLYGKETDFLAKRSLDRAFEIAVKVFAGLSEDLTNGALFYKNPNTSTSKIPSEGDLITTHELEEINEKGIRITTYINEVMTTPIAMGNHHFYSSRTGNIKRIEFDDPNSVTARYLNGDLISICQKEWNPRQKIDTY